MAKLKCQNSETSEPIASKSDTNMGDYIEDVIPHVENLSNRPSGVSRQIGEMLLSRIIFIFFLFVTFFASRDIGLLLNDYIYLTSQVSISCRR